LDFSINIEIRAAIAAIDSLPAAGYHPESFMKRELCGQRRTYRLLYRESRRFHQEKAFIS
jgi:hypothetical protein